eukprot:CAMPEP_0183383014 /NCGR_PEP_ID=MMETSP0164_2-20130417/127237_1 /TAXON_ID=221442 /ORGANISM="Coccolithus pelagicus ssp braarudi, Strain PLY182g" /LENGTH=88 /DNA_ID=CAMNT_0025560641 /DNA_START=915 /DNA_END=1182 /DNA_ORIENTATION=+
MHCPARTASPSGQSGRNEQHHWPHLRQPGLLAVPSTELNHAHTCSEQPCVPHARNDRCMLHLVSLLIGKLITLQAVRIITDGKNLEAG